MSQETCKLRVEVIDYDHFCRLNVSKRLWEQEHDTLIPAMSHYLGKRNERAWHVADVERIVFELEFPTAHEATLFKLSML
jgi:hypothetical protein